MAAAAPSPKSMQDDLSEKSRKRESASFATTRTYFSESSVSRKRLAVSSAYTKPEQAAFRSKAAAFGAPISCWITLAILGVRKSEVTVHEMTSPISSGDIPAASIARSEACFPMYHVGSQPAIGRSVMPVLVLIHSSLVSTKRVKSSFVNICSGTYLPIPKMLIPINNSLAIKKYANMVVKTKKLCYSNNVGRLSDDLFRQTGIIPHI